MEDMSSVPVVADVRDVRARLRGLAPLIRDLEQAGQIDTAATVRLAHELAEEALAARNRSPSEAPPLLTTRQAGRALGVSIQTIRNWVAAGRIAAVRRGVRTMIPRQAVFEEIERSRVPAYAVEHGPDDASNLARRKRLLAALPPDVVRPLDALHDKMEHGEALTADERTRMVALEREMIDEAARILSGEIRRGEFAA